jgi:hypothetical protein
MVTTVVVHEVYRRCRLHKIHAMEVRTGECGWVKQEPTEKEAPDKYLSWRHERTRQADRFSASRLRDARVEAHSFHQSHLYTFPLRNDVLEMKPLYATHNR